MITIDMTTSEGFQPVVDNDLKQYESGWQFGEQGILIELVKRLKTRRLCVEVGAGNGDSLPVTIEPLYLDGWQTVLWEIDREKRNTLKQLFPVASIFGQCLTLDLSTYKDGLVVIDVDGPDWWLFASLMNANQKPSVVMVEHADLRREQPIVMPSIATSNASNQATFQHLEAIAAGMYTLLGVTRVNSIFVRNDLLEGARYASSQQ